MPEREPIGVIGAGWVGLVTAACFSELGHEVYVRDIVQEKVESLARGDVPIYEPGLPELILKNSERLHFTTDMGDVLENANLLFCCVDTPPLYSGDADLSRVERVVEELGDSREHAIVMKSTVPVGTGRSIRRRRDDLGYVSNPEFLKEGTAVDDFMNPDRVVVGAGPESQEFGDRVAALYEPLNGPIVRTDVASAEMIKLASNAFLATKISFINEIANVSEELGADVNEVARGMGLDNRIGPQFLRAGIGYGGSCLVGEETVLVRRSGRVWLWSLSEMFERISEEQDADPNDIELLHPDDLEVMSWRAGRSSPEFLPVSVLTRRDYEGDLIEVATKMGRRVTCTPDHPFVVADSPGGPVHLSFAKDVTNKWVPLAQGAPATAVSEARLLEPVAGAVAAGRSTSDLRVRMTSRAAGTVSSSARGTSAALLGTPADASVSVDIPRGRTPVPLGIELDEAFWRVVGLYLAEGHCALDPRTGHRRLQWCFHPENEMDLVEEVLSFWTQRGVHASIVRQETTTLVRVSAQLVVDWWVDVLGMSTNCYAQRMPDAVWAQRPVHKRAVLSGMWRGDGSWSLINGGPSVILEYGTVSRELADGTMRLLAEFDIVVSQRVGRTRKSTRDTYWLRVSGAEQVERLLDFVPPGDRATIQKSISRQQKRIAPTGYKRYGRNAAWLRVVRAERRRFTGSVYSMEVPESHTFVTTGNLVVSNCFPKDVSALKQLAGNTGYHFQLLTAVIEVNELQKRRTIQKLQKHLGSLVGKEIALLGISFKPQTDDIREATSLVLSARLQSEGAHVRAFDPVAGDRAAGLLGGAEVKESAVDALTGAHGAVLVTEWPEFRELDWEDVKGRMAQPLIVDGRNFLDSELLERIGFTYEGVGRAHATPLGTPTPVR